MKIFPPEKIFRLGILSTSKGKMSVLRPRWRVLQSA